MSERPPPAGAVAPATPSDAVAVLEGRLGVVLPDRAVALAALTHKSYVNEHREEPGLTDNERLEFLGDAVIDLAVSHRLMLRFPGAKEGDLSKMRAAVVDEQGLAELARGLDLGPLLRLGRGEELTGGRGKASLLSDAMEAVIAAVYLCHGFEPVLALVDRFLGPAFARAAAGTLDRDWKTQLQELAQSRLRATPRYRVVAEHGPDHSKVFEVETDLRGEVLGRGAGRSKKDAEQAAARLALGELGRRVAEPVPAAPEPAVAAAALAVAAAPAALAPEPDAGRVRGAAPVAGAEAESERAPAHLDPLPRSAGERETAPADAAPPAPAPVPRRRRAAAGRARAAAAPKRPATSARRRKTAPKRAPKGRRAKR